jgi:putative hydrolase of the HAD superfamily
MAANPYRVIFLDLGGVVVHVDVMAWAEALASTLDKDVGELLGGFIEDDLVNAYEEGRLESEDFYQRMVGRWGLRWSYVQFVEAWNRIIREHVPMKAWLLHWGRRHRLMALSNTNALHVDYMRDRLGVLPLFEHVVASCEVGARKPHAAIYEHAIGVAGCAPAEILYIDDRLENLTAGRRHGLQGLHCPSPEALPGLLEAFLGDAERTESV